MRVLVSTGLVWYLIVVISSDRLGSPHACMHNTGDRGPKNRLKTPLYQQNHGPKPPIRMHDCACSFIPLVVARLSWPKRVTAQHSTVPLSRVAQHSSTSSRYIVGYYERHGTRVVAPFLLPGNFSEGPVHNGCCPFSTVPHPKNWLRDLKNITCSHVYTIP